MESATAPFESLTSEPIEEVTSTETQDESGMHTSNALTAVDHPQPVPEDSAPNEWPRMQCAERDVGAHGENIIKMEDISGVSLLTDRQRILGVIQDELGGKQVSSSSLSFAPIWVMEEDYSREMEENWEGAYEFVNEKDVPISANKIGCHAVYKVKESTDGKELMMKARNVLHGHRDKGRFSVRRDSASADLAVVRLLISLGVLLSFSFGTADVKGAYMQSGPALREIFVQPPREFKQKGKIWKLSRLPYGIVEEGRQWLCAIENWMVESFDINRVFGDEQLFVRRGQDVKIQLIIAKVVDDFLLAGTESQIQLFFGCIQKEFKLGASKIGRDLKFLGCAIKSLEDGSMEMSTIPHLERIRHLQISRERKSAPNQLANERERSEYRSPAGTILYLGQAILPQACIVASKMQQKLGLLRISHLIDSNSMLKDLKALPPRLLFKYPCRRQQVIICTMSDASHGASD